MSVNWILKLMLTPLILLSILNAMGQEKSKEMKQGTEYFFNKQYDRALLSFQMEFKLNPSTEVKFWIAHTYAEMNEIDLAKPLFLEIVRSDYQGPEFAMSLNNLGVCYAKVEQNDSAYYYFDKAIKDFPAFAASYLDKGQLLYSESRFEGAKMHLNKAIELDSTNWLAYQTRLEVCFASQDYECALKDLIKVRELKSDAKNEMNIAYCYTMLKRYNEADSIFQMIYNDEDAILLNNYGMNKYNMGKTKEGKEIILKSLSINPDNCYAYRNLAIIAIHEGDKVVACEYLNKAQSLEFEMQYGNEVNELLSKHCN